MKNMVYCLLCNLLLVALVILTSCGRHEEAVCVVPAPVYMQQEAGSFDISDDTCISVVNDSQMAVAGGFAGLFATPAGFVPAVDYNDDDAEIRLIDDSSVEREAYRMYVTRKGIDIYASSAPGFFYAFQTLRQALPSAIESDVLVPDARWTVPAMVVYDAPRFEYRGLMVDVSRYFLPKEDLLEIIDCMAMLKLNNLHLHLTDDNGWRLEIRKYPRLTSVGAWRADRGETPFPDRKNPVRGEPTPIGGYYTQDDIREIVAYAADRQINVIPEIDMPAHSNSALAAYPQYACPVVDEFIGVLPGLGGKKADIIYCAGNDDVFAFLKDVMDEVCGLFPSKYIHLGGDEAWKTHWKKCPYCQERIDEEDLDNEEELQGWFMDQMNEYLRSKGRIMMGWDEITDSDIPEGAVVFGWRNDGKAALKAAQEGHDFIMTPSNLLYLIRYQGPQWFEPLTYFGNSTLKMVYDYEPVDQKWPVEYQQKLLGVQGSMWTEFCDCPEDVTYQIFPRIVALAEVAWSPTCTRNWENFIKRLDSFNAHLDEKGVVYSRAMYNIQHTVTPSENGQLVVDLQCERPDVTIRYTLDGSEPDSQSPQYPGAFTAGGPVTIKAATFFDDGSQAGKTLVLPLDWNTATSCRIHSSHPSARLLVNGVQGSLRQTDFEWCHFDHDASIIVDLGKSLPVDKVSVGGLTNYGMAFNKPGAITVSVSQDGSSYTPVGQRRWTKNEIFCEGNFREDIAFSFSPVPARYVRIQADHPGPCPDGHIRSGQMSKYCFDEIEVSSPMSAQARLARQSQKNLIRWATTGGM